MSSSSENLVVHGNNSPLVDDLRNLSARQGIGIVKRDWTLITRGN